MRDGGWEHVVTGVWGGSLLDYGGGAAPFYGKEARNEPGVWAPQVYQEPPEPPFLSPGSQSFPINAFAFTPGTWWKNETSVVILRPTELRLCLG